MKESSERNVEEILIKDIINGNIKPGESFDPERELAVKMGYSRPVIHKAFIRLEQKGLVRIRPRKGVEVLDYKEYGKLSLLESIQALDKKGIDNKLNIDMLEFIKSNLKSVFLCFLKVDKKALEIVLDTESDLFDLLHQYSLQSGNQLYTMLFNEFRVGIHNVAKYIKGDAVIKKIFMQIETLLNEGKVIEATVFVDTLFDQIKIKWLGDEDESK